ncbi:hypothetical protein ACGF5O_48115 [Streptomyces sp. NPDC048291]|uniref:hypothetical protein n=1 Tax=Streptomyces sp. NPDC048291 TaxID=3365530 RepID=UPI003720687B
MPEQRGQGIGSALVAAASEHAAPVGAVRVEGLPPSGVADQAGGICRSRRESLSPETLLGFAEPGPAVIARRPAAARAGRLRSGVDGP